MKIEKSLLQAIVVGLALGATTSCSMSDTTSDLHLSTCEEGCEVDHAQADNGNGTHNWDNCPACGMG